MGERALKESTVAKIINKPPGPLKSLEDAWKSFNKSQGSVNQGLINRRNCEWITLLRYLANY